jgi:Domain of unknown function (DUF4173)
MRTAIVGAAVCAGLVLPGGPLGLGMVLVVALIAIAVARTGKLGPADAVMGSLAILLACAPVLRDADWVVAVDLTAAWFIAAAAVSGPHLALISRPFFALGDVRSLSPRPPEATGAIVRGLVVGVAVVVPFLVLFLSADAAFAQVIGDFPLPDPGSVPLRVAVFALVLLAALALALAARLPRTEAGDDDFDPRRTLSIWEWTIPLVLLNVLFMAFVAVQAAVLFGGHGHVLRSAGLTYAEYARTGFWYLIVAAVLTLVVVAAAGRAKIGSHPGHRRALVGLLAALTAMALVVLLSALWRLRLYEDAFGLTRLRFAAIWLALFIGFLLILAVAALMSGQVKRHYGRVLLAGAAVGLIAFTLANPDAWIARANVERWRDTGRLDVEYARSLSADATPALAALPSPLRSEALAPVRERLDRDEPWTSLNIARHRAQQALAD